MFLTVRKGMTDSQDWGLLYNKYHDKQYNSNALETDIQKLLVDDDVTKNAGVIPYVLSDRTKHDEKNIFLSVSLQMLRSVEFMRDRVINVRSV